MFLKYATETTGYSLIKLYRKVIDPHSDYGGFHNSNIYLFNGTGIFFRYTIPYDSFKCVEA